ncbi:CCC motif membrane protein [Flavobacteriaceae bacterium]|nr:CCC motif membrane protein [Flavobacteriaceae bacterium]MDB4289721.1 CCC motif membrane protein [Flavobacteriaceae bacterium]MDC1265631.1 CCC motif membrane protein [Flavobacteriaceae bacterium]
MKKQLNTTLIYVLSIFGFLCCCFGGLGFLLSGPAYLVAHNKVKDASENPDDFEGDINAMNTAKIIALVSLIINLLFFTYILYLFLSGRLDELFEVWNEAMEEIKRNS